MEETIMRRKNYLLIGNFLITAVSLILINVAQAQEEAQVLSVLYDQGGKNVKMGSVVKLQVKNLGSLKKGGGIIVPFLDGLALDDVNTSFPMNGTVEFVLRRTAASKDSWDNIISRRKNSLSTVVNVSIGKFGQTPIESLATLEIELVNRTYAIAFSILFMIILGLFLYCAVKSNIIRDAGKEPTDHGLRKPFSISRVQMAIWFFLVIGTYPFIYLITGDLGSISSSLLGLMGISAGTAFSAAVIDGSKSSANVIAYSQLKAKKNAFSERIIDIENSPDLAKDALLLAELTNNNAKVFEIEESLKELPNFNEAKASRGYFRDMVSDAGGVSFHRFQIFSWTLVLAIIFIIEVVTNLKMPEFSATLLGLMGVSSGTYIGFKFPELPKVA
tara:strand:- start:2511 stop:3674 length:1164 start_codon:yes stop_codon:yes gene_type:complete